MTTKKILVTGATGFVGRSLCRSLKSSGYIVCPTSRAQPSNQSKIKYFVTGNINGDTDWSQILTDVDVVIHLAARAHILDDRSDNHLTEYRQVNTVPTIKLGLDAIKAGARRFIFVSSAGVNGAETFGDPFRSADLAAPHSPYAISKYEAECELKSLFQGTATEFVILRPPLIYGFDAPGNFALIMRLVRSHIPIPLGYISNKRSFISLDNFVGLVEACISHPKAANKTLLVSDGVDLSTSEFIKLIGILIGKKPFLFWLSPKLMRFFLEVFGKKKMAQSLYGDMQIYSQDTFELLDWTPTFSPLAVLSSK
jgi:nucleoside-diphosphate-sugar epimerase